MTPSPFTEPEYDLGPARLRRLATGEVAPLAAAIAAIDPWARLGYPESSIEAFFHRVDAGTYKFAIDLDGAVVGTVSVRYPFLKGPYLELLAVLPAAQGKGIGAAVIDWMGREVAGRERNLWVCVSDFNDAARAFYRRQGFDETARLDDLTLDDATELFLRKRL